MNKKHVFVFLFVIILLVCGLNGVSAEDTTNDTITTNTVDDSSQIIKDTTSVSDNQNTVSTVENTTSVANDQSTSKISEQNTTSNTKQTNKTLKSKSVTVTTYADLRLAINEGDADEIYLNAKTLAGSSRLDLSRPVTIYGQGAELIVENTIYVDQM
ncbi:hypothetical protein [Methanosphaera sp.]